jgi:hypothetical protein
MTAEEIKEKATELYWDRISKNLPDEFNHHEEIIKDITLLIQECVEKAIQE